MSTRNETNYIYVIQFVFGGIWLKSALSKLLDPTFIDALAKTLIFFASKNPLLFYKNFLVTVAIPNAELFAQLTRWGEFSAAVLLIVTALGAFRKNRFGRLHELAILGSLIGAFLNLQFGLASFWITPANETLNLLMFIIQLVILTYHYQFVKQRLFSSR